jgi:aminopeptidase N
MRSLSRLLAVCAVSLLLGSIARSQEPHFGPMRFDRGSENRVCDLVKVKVELTLDEREETFGGSVTHDFLSLREGLEEIWFDMVALEIERVEQDGAPVSFRVEKERLVVELSERLPLDAASSVEVHYSGASPRRGLHFIGPDEDDPDLGFEIWSQGQSENNRHWIPTWDYPTDRATFEAIFTVHEGLTVVSNGELVGTTSEEEGWTSWHWKLDFPFPGYLISICVGDYERYVDDFRGIPVEYFVQRGVGEETARRSFGRTPDMLAFFSDAIGIPYPYRKYSQVAVQRFIVGGMENISATTQTDRTLHDERQHLDRSSDSLVAHELAHQWWGDYLTCRTWRHLWLNEGFATYFEALFQEHDQGSDEFRLSMRGTQRSARGRDRVGSYLPLVESFFNRRPRGGGGNSVYVKGASVLHMIRTLLGDELWSKAIHYYGTKHAGELVDTSDLEIAIEESTGFNLHWLFEEYVYLPGHPVFEVAQSWDAETGEVVLEVRQVQSTEEMVPIFRYPVPIEVTWDGGRELHHVWIEEAEEEVRLPSPSEPLMVRFDKGSAMYKALDFPKSAVDLAYQIRHDDDPVGRIRGVEEIAAAGDEALARSVLLDVLASDDHREIRAAAADHLLPLVDDEVRAGWRNGLTDGEPLVRRHCARALGKGPDDPGETREATIAALVETLRADRSYEVQAASIEALSALAGEAALGALREAMQYSSPGDRIATAALEGRLQLGDESALAEVIDWAVRSDGAARRASGLRLLGAAGDLLEGEGRERVVDELIGAAREGKGEVQRAAISSLGRLRVIEARELLTGLLESEGRGRSAWRLRMTAQRALQKIEPEDSRAAEEARGSEAEAPGERSEGPSDAIVERIVERIGELEAELETLRAQLEEESKAQDD